MKLFTAFIAALFVLASCNQTAKALNERVAGADSIAINYFKGGGMMDSVSDVKIIRDKKPIEELTGLITKGSAYSFEKNKHGYNGSLHFFKNDRVIQDIYFCNSKECSQFVFSINGQWHATRLYSEAMQFLSATQTQ